MGLKTPQHLTYPYQHQEEELTYAVLTPHEEPGRYATDFYKTKEAATSAASKINGATVVALDCDTPPQALWSSPDDPHGPSAREADKASQARARAEALALVAYNQWMENMY